MHLQNQYIYFTKSSINNPSANVPRAKRQCHTVTVTFEIFEQKNQKDLKVKHKGFRNACNFASRANCKKTQDTTLKLQELRCKEKMLEFCFVYEIKLSADNLAGMFETLYFTC